MTRQVKRWSDQTEAKLQDAMSDMDWDMHQASSDEVNMFAEVALGFILVDDSLPTDTINTFPNQKPWEDKKHP